MSIFYQILPDQKLIVTRYTGHVDGDEYRRRYNDMINDPAYVIGIDELNIVDKGTVIDVPFEVVRAVAADVAEANKDLDGAFTTVIVKPADVPGWNMALYEGAAKLAGSPEQLVVVETLEAALEKLGRADDWAYLAGIVEELRPPRA